MNHEAHTLTLETTSPEQTERLGQVLSELAPEGTVFALRGELASGKTCLVRGMAERFRTGELVASPTFTIVNQYGTEHKLYHVDLYRLESPEEIIDLGYEELFEPDGVCVVEWAERAEPLLPARRVDVHLEHAGETCRRLTITDHGVLPEGWAGQVEKSLAP